MSEFTSALVGEVQTKRDQTNLYVDAADRRNKTNRSPLVNANINRRTEVRTGKNNERIFTHGSNYTANNLPYFTLFQSGYTTLQVCGEKTETVFAFY